MIASLTGTLEKSLVGRVVVNVNGVGYLVHVPLSTQARLPAEGENAKLTVTMVVREDEIALYGFLTEGEQAMFGLLTDVNGVGPKLALKILSGIEPPRLRSAIMTNDLKLLSSISGVGKKLAERLTVELKDKVVAVEGMETLAPARLAPVSRAEAEAVEALSALGYQPRVAKKAVEAAARDGQTMEELIREALKLLAPKR